MHMLRRIPKSTYLSKPRPFGGAIIISSCFLPLFALVLDILYALWTIKKKKDFKGAREESVDFRNKISK